MSQTHNYIIVITGEDGDMVYKAKRIPQIGEQIVRKQRLLKVDNVRTNHDRNITLVYCSILNVDHNGL